MVLALHLAELKDDTHKVDDNTDGDGGRYVIMHMYANADPESDYYRQPYYVFDQGDTPGSMVDPLDLTVTMTDETARDTIWNREDQGEKDGVKVSRFRVNWSTDDKTLYGYTWYEIYDSEGNLVYVSAEGKINLNTGQPC